MYLHKVMKATKRWFFLLTRIFAALLTVVNIFGLAWDALGLDFDTALKIIPVFALLTGFSATDKLILSSTRGRSFITTVLILGIISCLVKMVDDFNLNYGPNISAIIFRGVTIVVLGILVIRNWVISNKAE